MGVKNWIFANEDSEDKPKIKETPQEPSKKTTFPTEQTNPSAGFFGFGAKQPPQPTFTPSINTGVSQEHVDKALQVYQQGFDSLNQSGYDFYEFYQGLSEEDRSNPSVYAMAFRMASAMDKSISKEKLIGQADFYIGKIIESYNSFVANGNGKKQELLGQKEQENHSLTNDLGMLKQQLEAIQIQIADKEQKLLAIDSKYTPKLIEVDSKLAANDIAKNKIVSSIEQVKQGIINNVK